MRDDDATGGYDDLTLSELEEMEWEDDYGYIIDLNSHVWDPATNSVAS